MSKETGGLAFPSPHYAGLSGMTLRDYFAAQAMQALLSQRAYPFDVDLGTDAYAVADIMLAERAK